MKENRPHVRRKVMIEVRATVILLGSAGCAFVTGALGLAASASWPESLLAAGGAAGVAVGVLTTLVKDDDSLK